MTFHEQLPPDLKEMIVEEPNGARAGKVTERKSRIRTKSTDPVPTTSQPSRANGPPQGKQSWKDRVFSAVDLCDAFFPEVKYIVPGVIPEGVTLLASRPKIGKSWMLLQIGSAVALGRDVLVANDNPTCGDVLALFLEDGKRRIKRRMTKYFGANRECWPARMHVACEWAPFDAKGLEDIEEWCKSVPKPTLIMIDVLAKVRPAKRPNQNEYAVDYEACEGLKRLAHKFPGLAVIVAHHDRKMSAEDVYDTVSGTLGLTGGVDTIALLKRTTAGTTLHVRGRDLVDEVEKAVSLDRETCRWIVQGDASEVMRSETRNAVLDVLRNAPEAGMTVKDVAAEANINRDLVDKTLQRMAKDGEVRRVSRGRYAL
jgi:hypothetical protein